MADAATWKERVTAWRASGKTAAEFCAGQDFSKGGLHYWSHKLGRLGRDDEASRGRARGVTRLLRVQRKVGPAPGDVTTRPAQDCAAVGLVLEVAGIRIAVNAGFDRATLASVLDVVRQLPARSAP
jgi:transposase